ncbi:hypothetical protein BDN72DRAFT_865812 [Pluteus cervinus]|uniref:Uncharacterized protein n=1 Tax=Pluteus cervinus TaxID=181527 RepID=A0ACD2ZYF3_9AGAR|nr:hypothetical protein BDN72DRAFT_865812 [Pluteus cervinus]
MKERGKKKKRKRKNNRTNLTATSTPVPRPQPADPVVGQSLRRKLKREGAGKQEGTSTENERDEVWGVAKDDFDVSAVGRNFGHAGWEERVGNDGRGRIEDGPGFGRVHQRINVLHCIVCCSNSQIR